MTTSDVSTARSRRVRRRLSLGRFARNSDGATAVEFALLAMPFLLTLFAIIEFGVSLTTQQLLANATEDVAREIRTGQITDITPAELQNKICERIELLVSENCPGLRVDLRSYGTFQAAANQQVVLAGGENVALIENGNPTPVRAQVGGSGARQTLRSFYFWPVMTNIMQASMANAGNGKMLISASQTWKNEEY